MSEIVDFLNAHYDRIEKAARKAGERSATWQVNGTWHLEGVEHDVIGEEEAFCHPYNADHIAFHDPAFVLADIESKRRILAEHDPSRDPCDAHDASFETVPCPTLFLLAAPFSGEPGYKQEWAI